MCSQYGYSRKEQHDYHRDHDSMTKTMTAPMSWFLYNIMLPVQHPGYCKASWFLLCNYNKVLVLVQQQKQQHPASCTTTAAVARAGSEREN